MADEISENIYKDIKLEYKMRHVGPLFLKSFLKMMIILLVAIQFVTIHPMIALIIFFIGYFTMPTSYTQDKPYMMLESYMRLLFGWFIAVLMWLIMSGTGLASNLAVLMNMLNPVAILLTMSVGGVGPAATILFWLCIAFFCTFPEKKEFEGKGQVVVNLGKEIFSSMPHGSGKIIGDIFFLLTAGIASYFAVFDWMSGFGGLQFFTGLVLLFGILGGWFAGREGRPFIGIIVIAVSLFAFSFAYSGTVGAAMFGQWWPAVQHYGDAIITPMGTMFNQVSQGMGDAWMLVTNPAQYYMIQQQRMQAQSQGQGSVLSVEFNEMSFMQSQYDPSEEHATGTIEMENKGEYNAKDVIIKLLPPTIPDKETGDPVEITGAVPAMKSCSGGDGEETDNCEWPDVSYPSATYFVSFDYDLTNAKVGEVNLNESQPTQDSSGNKANMYTFGSQYITFPFEYTFEYMSNVSLNVEVMDEDLLNTKLMNKQITQEKKTSQYSGGPVTISIYTEKQPVRSDTQTYGSISIMNQGTGMVYKGSTFDLYVPNISMEVKSISKSKDLVCTGPQASNIDNYDIWRCKLGMNLEPTKIANWAFNYQYTLPSEADSKTIGMFGVVNYKYGGEKTQNSLVIIPASDVQ